MANDTRDLLQSGIITLGELQEILSTISNDEERWVASLHPSSSRSHYERTTLLLVEISRSRSSLRCAESPRYTVLVAVVGER